MPSLRDHMGSKCPRCASDILQPAPSTNRMPGQELAWCPTCHATMGLAELEAKGTRRAPSLLGKLFGRPQRG